MTKATDDKIARLEEIVHRLENVMTVGPAPSPSAINPDGTPGHVVAGELIESAWGNAVSDTFTAHTATMNSIWNRVLGTNFIFGSATGTTDAGGKLHIDFPAGMTFSATPAVIVTNGNDTQRIVLSVFATTATAFEVIARLITDASPFAGQIIRVNWVAGEGRMSLS